MSIADGKVCTTPGRTRVSRSSMRNIHKQANLNWVGLTRNSIEEDQESKFSRLNCVSLLIISLFVTSVYLLDGRHL